MTRCAATAVAKLDCKDDSKLEKAVLLDGFFCLPSDGKNVAPGF